MSTKVDLTGGLRTFYGTPAVASSGGVIDPVAQAVPTPALRKVREGRGTRFVGDANEIKRLGHPAAASVVVVPAEKIRGWPAPRRRLREP